MEDQQIRFDDGASYERMMGVWSRLAGDVFLDWLNPGDGLRWIDVGCGNGAFTERVVKRFAPTEIHGVDPSEAQLNFARARPGVRTAVFHLGDAMALPFPSDRFDVAVMALVIFFVPDPAKGVAEMVRVVRRGYVCTTVPVTRPPAAVLYHPRRRPRAIDTRTAAIKQAARVNTVTT